MNEIQQSSKNSGPRVGLRLFLLLSVLATFVLATVGLTFMAQHRVHVFLPDNPPRWLPPEYYEVTWESDWKTMLKFQVEDTMSSPSIPILLAVLFLLAILSVFAAKKS